MTEPLATPAQRLVGCTLDGGFKVLAPLERGSNATGGANSHCYMAEAGDGGRYFIKVLDISEAWRCYDSIRVLSTLTTQFLHESDLSETCRSGRLRRVAAAVRSGQIHIDNFVVPYLVFELADSDVRTRLDDAAWLDIAWILRSLHQVATGMFQLHGKDIAHQDVKPSNILVYGAAGSKVADLGALQCGAKPRHTMMTPFRGIKATRPRSSCMGRSTTTGRGDALAAMPIFSEA